MKWLAVTATWLLAVALVLGSGRREPSRKSPRRTTRRPSLGGRREGSKEPVKGSGRAEKALPVTGGVQPTAAIPTPAPTSELPSAASAQPLVEFVLGPASRDPPPSVRFTDNPGDYEWAAASPPFHDNVHFSRHTPTGAECVLKAAEDSGGDLAAENRQIANEVRVLRALNEPGAPGEPDAEPSPFIERLLHSFQWESREFAVLEWVHGEDLKALCERTDRTSGTASVAPPAELREMVAQVVLALERVHRRGFVHNDLKCGNLVRCARTGRVVMIDFGSTVEAPRNGRLLYESPPNTMIYTPPEKIFVAKGKRGYDCSADLYSLGVTIYILYCGHEPYDVDRYAAIARKYVRDGTTTPARACAQLDADPAAKDLVTRLLDFEAGRRPGAGPDRQRGLAALKAHPFFSAPQMGPEPSAGGIWQRVAAKYVQK